MSTLTEIKFTGISFRIFAVKQKNINNQYPISILILVDL